MKGAQRAMGIPGSISTRCEICQIDFEYFTASPVEGTESKFTIIMKKPIILLAVALVSLFAAPAAEARGPSRSYVSFHRSCSGPAWVETYVAFYDSCGHPVFRTRVVPIRRVHSHHVHRPVVRHIHGHGHGHGHSHRGHRHGHGGSGHVHGHGHGHYRGR